MLLIMKKVDGPQIKVGGPHVARGPHLAMPGISAFIKSITTFFFFDEE